MVACSTGYCGLEKMEWIADASREEVRVLYGMDALEVGESDDDKSDNDCFDGITCGSR